MVYTAVYGYKDNLKEPPAGIEADFVCFTDNPKVVSDYYRVVHVPAMSVTDNRISSRIFKMYPHLFLKEYKYTVWIDASILIKSKDFLTFLKKEIGENEALFVKHPDRKSLKQERNFCTKIGWDSEEYIMTQGLFYEEQGFKDIMGLVASGLMVRRNNPLKVHEFNEDWFDNLQSFARRDQLSIMYLLWKHNIKFKALNLNLEKNKYFKLMPPNQ